MSESKELCPICQDTFNPTNRGRDIKTLNCQHKFHTHCINKWIEIRNLCPLCQQVADPNQPVRELQGNDDLSQQLISSLINNAINSTAGHFWSQLMNQMLYHVQLFPSNFIPQLTNIRQRFYDRRNYSSFPNHHSSTCDQQTQCAYCLRLSCAHFSKRCSRCHQIRYCNEICQRAHWNEHKKQCKIN
jgi:chemotaxis protein CheY-P-specific phosphatase CheC